MHRFRHQNKIHVRISPIKSLRFLDVSKLILCAAIYHKQPPAPNLENLKMSSMISDQADEVITNDQMIANDDGNDFENDEYYTKSAQYWNSVESTIDGM